MDDATPVIRTEELSKTYGSGHTAVKAVDSVDLTVAPGELVLIMGPSGSGKTTLLSMLGGLLRPSAGRVVVDGVDLTELSESDLPAVRARRLGFVFQAFNLLAALSAEGNVCFPARLIGGRHRRQAPERARELLGRLGLAERSSFLPRDLSGGEKQRVAVARALINDPKVILADEPTGNLDSETGREVAMILHDIARDEGRTVIIVTHDPRLEEVADRILWLEDGKLRDRPEEVHEWVRDPVCGMSVDQRTASIAATHQGNRYFFCTERCRERFVEEPGRYLQPPEPAG